MLSPALIYRIPIIGLVKAMYEHHQACSVHSQLCDAATKCIDEKGFGNCAAALDATWPAFDQTVVAFGHCMDALAWTTISPLLLIVIVGVVAACKATREAK
jgi:hypothetical protein